MGLYLIPKALGQKLGERLYLALKEEFEKAKVETITLESTLNSVGFYQKFGFVPREPITIMMGEQPLRCIPMSMQIRPCS